MLAITTFCRELELRDEGRKDPTLSCALKSLAWQEMLLSTLLANTFLICSLRAQWHSGAIYNMLS